MLSLLYLSRSRLSDDDFDRQLADIMSAAVSRNLDSGITGALVATGEHFAQVLEGEESAVANIMSSIMLDPRHDDVRIIAREQVAQRSFPNWGMALVGYHPETMSFMQTIWTARDDATLQKAIGGLVGWMRNGASARVVRPPRLG